ncbi:hypothetical protein LCGC14_0528490, partial [marine sediment metagenome]
MAYQHILIAIDFSEQSKQVCEKAKQMAADNQASLSICHIIEDFPIGSQQINQLMPLLLAEINASEILSRRLFSAEFLTTLSGEALITLIYHKPLNEEWQETALKLQQQLGVAIIGRSRKQKTVLDRDYVIEKLQVSGKEYQYQQVETGFTQPNAGVNQKMLEWALKQSTQCSGDLVELYCGN